MKRDLTDWISWTAAAMLAVAAFLLPGERLAEERPAPVAADRRAELEREALERRLGHWPPAAADREALGSLAREEPGNSRIHVALGDLHQGGGDLAAAVESYRKALELNRGYADPRAPEYHGEELRRLAEEGLRVYGREKALRPGDEDVARTIKDLYFIRRTLAGGCD